MSFIKNPFDGLSGSATTDRSTRDLTPPRDIIKMSIEPVNEPFSPNLTKLLINANTISESKAANWIKHYIPGQSDPLLQWINGAEKTISFTAMVTKDIANNPTLNVESNSGLWELIIDPELNNKYLSVPGTGAPVLQSLGTKSPNGVTLQSGTGLGNPDQYWSRSIQPMLDYYRKLVIPRASSSPSLTKSPPLVYLKMGTILGAFEEAQTQKYILLQYTFAITEYTPQLEPTKASVSFTFVEYVDRSKVAKPTSPLVLNGTRQSDPPFTIPNATPPKRDNIGSNFSRFNEA